MKKHVAYTTAFLISMLLWGLTVRSCYGGPGGPAAPRTSQVGKRKTFDPRGPETALRKIKHKCDFQNRDSAETNSWFETICDHDQKVAKAKEYSEFGEIGLDNNLYYVKYKPRNSRLYGSCGCEHCGDNSAQALGINRLTLRNSDEFGTYSQIGKVVVAEDRNMCRPTVNSTDWRTNVDTLWIKCG